MKFTKDEAIQNLKGQFTTKGTTLKLSDRTINEALDSLLLFANDETELADFAKNAFAVLNSANGNLIKETADAIKAWNEAHPAPSGQKKDEPQPTGGLTAEAIAKLLDEKLTPIQNELNAYKNKDTQTLLVNNAIAAFDKKNPKDTLKPWRDEAVKMAQSQLTPEDTEATLAAKIEQQFNHFAKLAGDASPYMPVDPQGGQGAGEGSPEFYKAQKAELEKDGFIKK